MVAQQTPEDKIDMVFALSGGANAVGGKAGREEKREKGDWGRRNKEEIL